MTLQIYFGFLLDTIVSDRRTFMCFVLKGHNNIANDATNDWEAVLWFERYGFPMISYHLLPEKAKNQQACHNHQPTKPLYI